MGITFKKDNFIKMLSYGGVQFATSIFYAFSSYYMLAFLTDVALIPAAVAAALLFGLRMFSAAGDQAIGIYLNRASAKSGKYRPWFKRCALPYAICLAAVGFAPGFSLAGKVVYAAVTLALCELLRSALSMAAMSMLPYMAVTDDERSKYVSFSTAAGILSYLLVGTFMMPLVGLLGGAGGQRAGYAAVFVIFAIAAAPLGFNAYYRLSEASFNTELIKQPIIKLYAAIVKNKRLVLFFAGYCVFAAADAIRNLTAYYYVIYNIGRPEILPYVIMAGVLTPLAMQPIIPRLLAFAKKETLIIAGLFAASGLNFILPAISGGVYAIIICAVLYGTFTSVVVNLIYAMLASFSDEMRVRHEFQMSDVLSATLSLSYKIGGAVAGGAVPLIMASAGYSAQDAQIPAAAALASIKTLYFTFTAAGMALSGIIMLNAMRERRANRK